MTNQSHDHSACWANRAVVDELGALERTVAAWASVKVRTPEEIDVITRSAEKVIQRGALLGSLSEPEPA